MIELSNGMRVVHKEVTHTKIAHLGIMLDIGSRDEAREEQGLAHFWEHMAFKGTRKRKAFHIINRLESLGGELNAYTTKEKICFYATVLHNHFEKALELLWDITFNATFPENQINKERQVILEEMSMYKDSPEDALQDEFDELVFTDHALGANILGTVNTVSRFQHDDFQKFVQNHLNTEKIIISSVGNIPWKKLERVVRKYFDPIPHKNHTFGRQEFRGFYPRNKSIVKPITQGHQAIGTTAYPIRDKNRVPFFILTNILGGPALNSRLNLVLREKYGYAYTIEANYSPYMDTGLFAIYYATDAKLMKRSKDIVLRELEQFKKKPMGALQFRKSKQQIKGQLAMAEENYNSHMLMMAKSLLDLGKISSINEIFKKIDSLQAKDLQDLAVESLNVDKMSMLSFVPE